MQRFMLPSTDVREVCAQGRTGCKYAASCPIALFPPGVEWAECSNKPDVEALMGHLIWFDDYLPPKSSRPFWPTAHPEESTGDTDPNVPQDKASVASDVVEGYATKGSVQKEHGRIAT
jgi:hypothetical protein